MILRIFRNQNLKSNTFRISRNFYNCHFLTHFYCHGENGGTLGMVPLIINPYTPYIMDIYWVTYDTVNLHHVRSILDSGHPTNTPPLHGTCTNHRGCACNWGHVRKKKPGRCLQGCFPSSIGTIGSFVYRYIYIRIYIYAYIYIYRTSSIKQQPVSQISSSQATNGLTSAHRDARR